MLRENPRWAVPRFHFELRLLGYEASERTVAKYMLRVRKPSSQIGETLLDKHVSDIAACDFFTVPTATFRILYALIVIGHRQREVVHFGVTTNPHAEWTGQQVVNAFPNDETPRFMFLDRDGVYDHYFQARMEQKKIDKMTNAFRSP